MDRELEAILSGDDNDDDDDHDDFKQSWATVAAFQLVRLDGA